MENSGGSNNKVFEERSDISRLAQRNLNVVSRINLGGIAIFSNCGSYLDNPSRFFYIGINLIIL
jgi:hypothetical protein